MVVENLRIDVTPGGVPLVIHVSQYDAGLRQFVFTPYDKGVAMAKIAGATVAVEATKPDGYAVQHPCTYNNDGTITYTLQEQLAACEGQVWSKLTWRDSNGNILGAKAIVWAVDMAGIEDGAIVSTSDLPLIEQAAEFASEYETKVAEMIEEMQIVPGQVVIDGTLTVQGAAADAKATGDRLADLQSAIEQIEPGLSGNAKAALLACFRNVAWVSDDGATYYANLETALYGNYPKLIAAFDPGINVIYTDDALDTLKQYLTVTYYATEDSSGVILSPSDYTLSGTLIAGTSSVVVTYQNLSTTVTIPGVVDFYNIWEWNSTYTGAGKLTRTPARASEFTYQGTTKKGILYNTDLIAGNNNRGFATLRGKAPMVTQDNVTLSGFYPIPVPSTATKLTASVTPNTQRLSVMLFQYDPNNQTPAPYSRLGSIAWHTGSQEVTFSAASNLFIAFNCSVDSSFSQYTVEPDMHVLFERS